MTKQSQLQLDLEQYLQDRLQIWAVDAIDRYEMVDLPKNVAIADVFLTVMGFFLNASIILKIPDEMLIEKVREGLTLIRKNRREYMKDVF